MSSSAYSFTAIYLPNATPCQPEWIERIDYKQSNCTPSPLNTTCSFLPPSTTAPGNWSSISGCISSTDTLTLGKDNLISLQRGYMARVQFWLYSTPECSGSPTIITELDAAVTNCLKNVQGLTDPSGSIYQAEKVSVGLDGTIWRNYYSDEHCSQLFTSVKFPDTTTCSSKMKAVQLPAATVGFTERILYKGPGCTNPSSARITYGRETCGVIDCDSYLQGRVQCPSTNTLASDSKTLFASDNNYATITTFVDGKCSIFDYTESIRLDVCQPTIFSAADNPEVIRGNAFKAFLNASTIVYKTFADKDCNTTYQTLYFTTDGKCSQNVGISGMVLSIKGIDAALYSQQTSVPDGNGTSSSNAGLIGGIVGGIIVVLLLVIGGIFYYRRRKQYSPTETTEQESQSIQPHSAPFVATPKPSQPLSRNETALSDTETFVRSDSTVLTGNTLVMTASPVSPTLALSNIKEMENPLFRNISTPKTSTSTYNTFTDPSSAKLATVPRGQTVARTSNPEEWSIAQVAEWVSKNGGTPGPVHEQKIDGVALLALTAEELYIALNIATVGDRIKFKRALEGLMLAPPTYSE
ncbi:hypothetical protein HDU79_007991 [Rhizoclosmatium sp. JEL0117]|nr:hypothetical protein HDU79_007991 [Rhizoclosmatium sp. JEL0117]